MIVGRCIVQECRGVVLVVWHLDLPCLGAYEPFLQQVPMLDGPLETFG